MASNYSHWINPPVQLPNVTVTSWVVGEIQTLSWYIATAALSEIYLVQIQPADNNTQVNNINNSEYAINTNEAPTTMEGSKNSAGVTILFNWTVSLYGFNLYESNLFYFQFPYESYRVSSVFFEIANNRSVSSSATPTATASLATAATFSAITTSTTQSPTSSSSPSPATNGRSIETIGIALGLGIPVLVLAIIVVALFVLLRRKKTIPDPNPAQIEVPGDFLHRAELSGDRFFELPATGCS